MQELPHMCSIISAISFNSDLTDFFEKNRETIINEWVDYPAIDDIRKRLSYTKDEYRTRVATNVLGYFSTVLSGENQPGDCPVMRTIVKDFHALGLTVEDVFLNCTALKNVVLKLFDRHGTPDLKQQQCNLIMVMDHNLYGVLSIYSEIKRAHEAELEFRNRIIQENVLYTRTDVEGIIIEVTDAFCNVSGYEKHDVLGNTHSIFKHPEVDPTVYRELWETIKNGETWNGNLLNLRKDGTTFIATTKIVPVYDEGGAVKEYMVFRNDITSDELAKVDPLSGLYNRREFDAIFEKLSLTAVARNEPFSIILADIDHFKQINDTFGHHEGDDVIVRFAGILRTCTRNSDVCARWGGEEFVILLPNTELHTAFDVAERIRHAAFKCLHIGDYAVTSSFGVARLERGESMHDLFKRVDSYLYFAKQNGRNRTIAKRALPKKVNLSHSNTFSPIIP
ncbi:MAG: diguanylate cyclase [Campylobacterales bacterium]|nr:diguanylate cyclase [Campylobacterales bacterium]